VGGIEIAVIVAGGAVAALLMWPKLVNAPLWRATITPLASIIGSGFLILGPILTDTFGIYAGLAMAILCLAGYLFGAAIRFNIAVIQEEGGDDEGDGTERDSRAVVITERISSWALAFAYVISVAYYLNLFGAFAVRIVTGPSLFWGRVVTTAAYALILGAGLTKGFSLLERMEQATVSIKLAVIAALVAALAVFTHGEWQNDALRFSPPVMTGIPAVTMMFGLIVTVQGFETSRYLGNHYSPETRILSMKLSQWIATAIYIAYVAFLSVSFDAGSFELEETAIIDMMRGVSAILGPLLIIAALSAQFSAAVADTSGSGGLVTELSHHKVTPKHTYLGIAVIGLLLTWAADIFQIVSYASRAFALYYGLQGGLACARAYRERQVSHRSLRLALYGALAVLGVAAAVLGTPVEGN